MSIFNYFQNFWDPRPSFAKILLASSENYENALNSNLSLDPKISKAILEERDRILFLFKKNLPEYEDRISIVVTNNATAENCSVFLWKKRVYVLVSAALIGRPVDHPDDNGLKSWEWLALHEAAHILNKDPAFLFHTRRFFRFSFTLNALAFFLSFLFPFNETLTNQLKLSFGLLSVSWLIQAISSLFCEARADIQATSLTKDLAVLKDVKNSLKRMRDQSSGCGFFSIKRFLYLYTAIFVDPHPPLIIRLWLISKKEKQLQSKHFDLTQAS